MSRSAGRRETWLRPRAPRPARRGRSRTPTAEADPGGAHEQVREDRCGERRAPEHLPPVERPERQPERREREQIEGVPRQQPSPVDETEDEDGAQRDPSPPRVQHLAAEGADVSPRHLPGDLRARPCLGDTAVAVLDLAESDLPGLARPDANGPAPCRLVERRIGRGMRRVAVEPVRDLRGGQEARHGNALGQPRRPGDRGERRRPPSAPVTAVVEGRRIRGAGGRSEQQRERHGARPAPHRRKDQSLLPMKLSGVTSTIASACARISPAPSSTRRYRTTRLASSAQVETTRNLSPW